MAELKPCPFCGSKAYPIESNIEVTYTITQNTMTIKCSGCGVTLTKTWFGQGIKPDKNRVFLNNETAEEMWNKRIATEKGGGEE